MDEQRFDQITKRLGTARTRRATLKGLGVALLGAAGLATGLEAEAKRKGKRHGTSARLQITCLGNPCSTTHPCCAGFDCSDPTLGTCQCHLGACQHDTDCTCPDVTTCGAFGDTNGQCCRTKIGIYCNAPSETGSGCCGPAYICASPGAFPPPANGGCQCNTAAGFVNNNGVCECPAGQHVSDGRCVADQACIQPGQTCNACHSCCAGSTCTDPTHACNGSGGTCCLNNGQQGNANHPDLCCSGCVCPDGNCCDASHCRVGCTGTGQGSCGANQLCCNNICVPNDVNNCGTCGNHCSAGQTCNGTNCQQPQCTAPLIPCGTQCINPNNQCCAEDEIGVICPPDPRGQRKCCPAGHTCNPNKNGTYNCGKGHGGRGRQGRGRNQR